MIRGALVFVAFVASCSASEETTVADAAADAPPADTALVDAPADAACALTKPYSSKDAVCNGCAQSKCCAEVNGCLGDPRCDDDYVNCILACALTGTTDGGDAGAEMAGCLADCATKYPVGKAEYDTAIGCVDTKCGDTCK